MNKRRKGKNSWISVLITAVAALIVLFGVLSGEIADPGMKEDWDGEVFPSETKSSSGADEKGQAREENRDELASAEPELPTPSQEPAASPTPLPTTSPEADEKGLTLTVLEVGKADCLILQCDGENMIVDGGNEGDEEYILNHLKDMNLSGFKYLVESHPHEDHIGSLDAVVLNYPVDLAILSPGENTTRYYEDLLTALTEKKVATAEAKRGDTYQLGGATITVLSPDADDDWDNLNDWSVVLMVQYGQVKYLLMADAETPVESKLLEEGVDLSADVLKIGHHGSNTSSKKAFLNAVHPTLALITCDRTEKAGEPNEKVRERLEELDIPYLRTDLRGILTVYTDGEDIAVSTEREETAS